jgi:transcriptional regulator with XRE-family HTH domain
MTQADLATVSKLQSTYISDVERGVRNPSWSVIVVLSEALDTTPSNLLAVAERLADFI